MTSVLVGRRWPVAATAMVARCRGWGGGAGGHGGGVPAWPTARTLTDFAYVQPGAVLERARHWVRWSEDERYEVWKSDTLPYVDPTVATGGPGAVDVLNRTVRRAAEASGLDRPSTASAPVPGALLFVHLLRAVLEADGYANAVSEAEWAAVLAEPTPAEVSAVDSAGDRRATLAALTAEVEAAVVEVETRLRDAIDGGEVDGALPLARGTRDALSIARSRPLLLQALQSARRVGILTARMQATLPPRRRDALAATVPALFARLTPTGAATAALAHADATAAGRGTSPAGGSGAPNDLERSTGDVSGSYEEYAADVLAVRDRLERVPRAVLPAPLATDAPTPALADVAAVLDSNPSLTPDDRRYVLSLYADAMAGKASAFDWSAEKAAIVDPQPLWDVYDPDKVALQQSLRDAAKGQGAHSSTSGVHPSTRPVAPARLGHDDIAPGKTNLTASEEADAVAAAHDAAVARKVADASAAVTRLLEATLGTSVRRLGAPTSGATSASQIAAAKSKLAGGGDATPSAADVASFLRGVALPEGMPKPAATTVATSFFKQYAAGVRPAAPVPPPPGVRRYEPTEATLKPIARSGGTADKGGKGGKGGAAKPTGKK